ncbi:hypothetical protein A1O7_05454 [Cladophialophora yegresii CBS 114405]|uniref:Uncharacterized protein n=1 Tax=Cladophialophora yegresii CBS 114405 TaxID=1182544 RepID=W9W0K2_9EURO|nr:uncharacterized protein A1O7_05454 [Cladophialophora yegresii CBS 114405]EXJ58031.1 hypothetical protein A1O7_05454 [Cladophialophora yegresii CBS 114405]
MSRRPAELESVNLAALSSIVEAFRAALKASSKLAASWGTGGIVTRFAAMVATDTDKDECTGTMAFWADIDAEYVLKYQRWHNCEHMPERLSIPGFVEGRRYRALDDRSHFLMFYDTHSTSVLSSEAYMAALNKPTPWTREALTHFRNPTRGIFSRLTAVGRSRKFAAPYITSLRFDLPDEDTEAIYARSWVQAASEADNVERVGLYKAHVAIGDTGTSEQNVHGGGPGKQAYLVLIEESD